LGEFAGDFAVMLRFVVITAHVAEFGERAERGDGFGAEIDVVGEVAGEVVGAKLVFGIESLLQKVISPLFELGPVTLGEFCVAVDLRDRGQRISRLPLSSTGIWFSSVRSPPP
jgi:hypothetical protein